MRENNVLVTQIAQRLNVMTTTVPLHALMYMNVKEDKMCVNDRLKRCMLNYYSSKTLACQVIIVKRRITV